MPQSETLKSSKLLKEVEVNIKSKISQPQHYRHLGLDKCLLWGAGPGMAGC